VWVYGLAKAVLTLILAFVLTGCAYSCTAVGCISGVTIDLLDSRPLPKTATAKVCVDATCQTTALKRSHASLTNDLATLEAGQSATITLTITGPRGTTLVGSVITVDPQVIAPNGSRCGPVCTVANLRLVDKELISTAD